MSSQPRQVGPAGPASASREGIAKDSGKIDAKGAEVRKATAAKPPRDDAEGRDAKDGKKDMGDSKKDKARGEDDDGDDLDLDLDNLDLTTEDIDFDEVDGHIRENLEDDILKDALAKDVDLRVFAREIRVDLRKVERSSIQDYINEAGNIARLHSQIHVCDKILQTMEEMLGAFQEDLGNISSEIQTLQDQSLSMNVKLKNRKIVQNRLSSFLEQIALSPELVASICDGEVNDTYIDNLITLSEKIAFVKQHSSNKSLACEDVEPEYDKLLSKATDKVRDFLVSRIHALRKPMTNYQVAQQNLIRFKYLNQFMMERNPAIAKEIRLSYVETTSKMYYSLCKQYMQNVLKLQVEESPDKDDLLGVEDSVKKDIRNRLIKLTMKNSRATTFTLGDRGTLLSELESAVIVPAAAKQKQQKFAYESLFRCVHFVLVDNVASEAHFLRDFFYCRAPELQELFDAIFTRTIQMYLKHAETSFLTCFDAIGMMLCLRILHHYRTRLGKDKIACLDDYFERVGSAYIWPRLKAVLEANSESLRNADIHRLGSLDIHPHYVTRRYAEFAAALVFVNEGYNNVHVAECLGTMRSEMENLILRMAAEFPTRKEQLIFLINNYDIILSVLHERTTVDAMETELFQAVLNARITEFVEEELAPFFGGMIGFVKEWEPLVEKSKADQAKFDQRKLEQIVRNFGSDWKKAIDAINGDITRSFDNFNNGTTIRQSVLTQLIVYYQRFQNLLNQPPFKMLPIRNELINIHNVMVEVKKHKGPI